MQTLKGQRAWECGGQRKDGAKGGMEAASGPLAGWPTGAGQETALDLFFCRDQRAVPCQLWESFLTGCKGLRFCYMVTGATGAQTVGEEKLFCGSSLGQATCRSRDRRER